MHPFGLRWCVRAAILYNSASGRGMGERVAMGARQVLERRGVVVASLPTDREPDFAARLRELLSGTDLLVVAGGDGTLHSSLAAVVGTGIPVYHLALGTENLFARQFGMDRTPQRLDRAIAAWRTLDVDTGEAAQGGQADRKFSLMGSVGADAAVIRTLHQTRRGPISHLTYLRPIAAQVLQPWLPRLCVEVDGKPLVSDAPGMVVVANSRQYGWRIDPAVNASMTDGLLDVVFFPASGKLGGLRLARWVIWARFRRHLAAGAVYAQGRGVRVRTSGPRPCYQLDGECGDCPGDELALDFKVRERSLRVLLPG
jgi:diacylglycerol kinase (ATP)